MGSSWGWPGWPGWWGWQQGPRATHQLNTGSAWREQPLTGQHWPWVLPFDYHRVTMWSAFLLRLFHLHPTATARGAHVLQIGIQGPKAGSGPLSGAGLPPPGSMVRGATATRPQLSTFPSPPPLPPSSSRAWLLSPPPHETVAFHCGCADRGLLDDIAGDERAGWYQVTQWDCTSDCRYRCMWYTCVDINLGYLSSLAPNQRRPCSAAPRRAAPRGPHHTARCVVVVLIGVLSALLCPKLGLVVSEIWGPQVGRTVQSC